MRRSILVIISVGLVFLGIIASFNFGYLPITGLIVGTTNVTVSTTVQISLPVSNVNFGSLDAGQFNDTADNNPFPFVLQNDGNVNVNVTVSATDLWSSAANPSTYFRFNSTENETGSVVSTATDLIAWANMPSTATNVVTRLKFASANDAVNVHINITVPSDEPAGAKGSTVTFTASQA